MNKPIQIVITLLLVALVSLAGWNAVALNKIQKLLDKKETQPAFEYTIVAPYDSLLETEMNQLGKAGWEVLSARRATSAGGYSAKYELILKRQIR